MNVLVTYVIQISGEAPRFGNQKLKRNHFGISDNERPVFTEDELLEFAEKCAESETAFHRSPTLHVTTEMLSILAVIPLAS